MVTDSQEVCSGTQEVCGIFFFVCVCANYKETKCVFNCKNICMSFRGSKLYISLRVDDMLAYSMSIEI